MISADHAQKCFSTSPWFRCRQNKHARAPSHTHQAQDGAAGAERGHLEGGDADDVGDRDDEVPQEVNREGGKPVEAEGDAGDAKLTSNFQLKRTTFRPMRGWHDLNLLTRTLPLF